MTTGMQTHTVQRDDAPDLTFEGELIASASSNHGVDRPPRWTELELYRTRGGKLIAVEIGRTCMDGEHNRHAATVCADAAAVADALGHGWLAKELYADAGIDDDLAERVD